MRALANNPAEGIGAGIIALYIIIGIVVLSVTVYLIWVQVQIKNNTEETKDTLKEILKQMHLVKKDDNEKPKEPELTIEQRELENATEKAGGGFRKEEPPNDLENQSEIVKMYWKMKLASEQQKNEKKKEK